MAIWPFDHLVILKSGPGERMVPGPQIVWERGHALRSPHGRNVVGAHHARRRRFESRAGSTSLSTPGTVKRWPTAARRTEIQMVKVPKGQIAKSRQGTISFGHLVL